MDILNSFLYFLSSCELYFFFNESFLWAEKKYIYASVSSMLYTVQLDDLECET